MVAFLLTKQNPDFTIGNKISRSIYGQTNLRWKSTSVGGSFRLVTKTSFRFSFHLSELVPDYIVWSVGSAHDNHSRGMGIVFIAQNNLNPVKHSIDISFISLDLQIVANKWKFLPKNVV